MVEPEDTLSFKNNSFIKSKIGEEEIYFSYNVQKYSIGLFSRNQDKTIMITNNAFYTLDGTEIKRRIKLEDLFGVTVSTLSNQFIIHGNLDEYDYLFISPDKKKIIRAFQIAYKAKVGNDLKFCKRSEKDISKYVIQKKEAKKNPYLERINKEELSSIQEYIESDDSKISNINEEKDIKALKNEYNNDEKIVKTLNVKSNDNKIKEDYKYNELLNQLNEERNKSKKLLEELNKEKQKVKELNDKIKIYENPSNENIKKIKELKELEELIKSKKAELNNLRNNNNEITTIKSGEKIIAIFFTSNLQDIHRPISCKNTDTFVKIEEKIYNEYPQYKDYTTYLTVNGNLIKRFKTLEENGINDGNTIIVNIYDD